ncbi:MULTISPECIES: GNAT family N-acetyltransferase [unclassified Mycolicibacterium]|uniref:GNAT family N-acetyltransferase n=1 Tax=unclassified Mycolicibacterium TaxID=2636767 RepID=UPI0012DD85F7|nr:MULTISPECIES: GNAT family protein [unclassified Mycolicibacterium]MUL81741.1 GNAT family N-acetyltransferase [Mycolicibacterium sp. CBMA 329]MUL87507.1 GNAT family N-acetyltransferase [Mycolicibacterium sp. CBMA 331]MUL99628.1 GNAT family N-acetyltransferase [Mycolicibacterium sp. CBMA 334]MUM26725.1 GNAT family N-acetyltransferase [Mycolicibacterium sp. CBMA 295]MUM37804.1 GNAT family N-acetyltransferase [Mycolicibacterium sp. CBMA 247]
MTAAPTLSGVTSSGITVTLRTPRFSDAIGWRAARMANQEFIEPFWDHSSQSWPERHTRGAWVRECVKARRRMRRGAGLHFVIMVEGQLAGQCDAWIDRFHGRTELGLWVDSRLHGQGVAAAAARLVIAHLFAEPEIERIAAPIATGNTATTLVAQRLGFVCEGVLRSYMTVGSGRRDHELWSLTREDWARSTNGR